MSIHVLQLGPYPPPEGGITRNMLAIRDELLSRGDRCTIIATSKSTAPVQEPDVRHPRSAVRLLMLLRSLRYDVLHLHIGGRITPRVLALALACTTLGRGRKLLTVHSGGWPQTDAAKKASPASFAGMVLRRFDGVVAVSGPIADVLRRYGVPDDRTYLIPPYSMTLPSTDVCAPEEISAFYEAHDPVLLSVGGLERDYDPLLQVAALGEVLRSKPQAGLLIAGDGAMRAEVEAAVAGSGYAEHILLAGNVAHDVVLHLIRDADVMLRTTLFDGDAISVREALFLGTPVVATDNGIRPPGVHVVPTGDLPVLVKRISEVLAAPRSGYSLQEPDTSNIRRVIDLYDAAAPPA